MNKRVQEYMRSRGLGREAQYVISLRCYYLNLVPLGNDDDDHAAPRKVFYPCFLPFYMLANVSSITPGAKNIVIVVI